MYRATKVLLFRRAWLKTLGLARESGSALARMVHGSLRSTLHPECTPKLNLPARTLTQNRTGSVGTVDQKPKAGTERERVGKRKGVGKRGGRNGKKKSAMLKRDDP